MNDASIQERLTEVLAAMGQAQIAVQQGHQQTAINRLREAMKAGREAMRMAIRAESATVAAAAGELAEATLRRRALQSHRDDQADEYWRLVTEEQQAWSAYLLARSRAVERDTPAG